MNRDPVLWGRAVAAVLYVVAVAGLALSIAALQFPGAAVAAWVVVLAGSVVAYLALPDLVDGPDRDPEPVRRSPLAPPLPPGPPLR